MEKCDSITVNTLLVVLGMLQDWFKPLPVTQEMRDSQLRRIIVSHVESMFSVPDEAPLLVDVTPEAILLRERTIQQRETIMYFIQRLILLEQDLVVSEERSLLMADLRKSRKQL